MIYRLYAQHLFTQTHLVITMFDNKLTPAKNIPAV